MAKQKVFICLNDGQLLVVKEAQFQYFKENELWEHKNSERLAAIIIDIYSMMYVHMPVAIYSLTIKILSNMETKLFFLFLVDHKPFNIQTQTQLNRLRNVNAIVLFIQLHRSSTVHLRLFTVQPLPSQDGGELARRSKQCPSPCLFIRPFFSFPLPQQSAADFYKIEACEQKTFKIIK